MNSSASALSDVRTLAWAALSGALGVLAFLPAAVAGTWLSDVAAGGDPLRLGLSATIWTLLSAGLTIGLAKVVLLESRVARPPTLALAVLAGAAVAGLSTGALIIWTVDRYGYMETDHMGWSILLPVVLAVLTSSVAASLVTLGLARALALGSGIAGLAGLAFLVVDSAPGALDGISTSGPLLGLAFGAAAAYAALGTYILLRRDIQPQR